MILDYYNLADQPFGVTPDTRYLYLSPTHREALASLLYGVQSGRGFMSIIAKPGMGKTTLLFWLLKRLGQSARTVFLFQTLGGPADLLRSLLHDLGKDAQGLDLAQMHSQLNECLAAETRQGKQVVVVIDEAQSLSESALELLRMLSNFETPQQKLMQIILAGQPQLAEKLASPNLVQLRQRISIVARLKPFTLQETNLYVGHRLRVAEYDFHAPLFTARAGAMIAKHGEGIPRNINNICFNALSLACALKRKPIDEEIIREVLDDLDLGCRNDMAMTVPDPNNSTRQVSASVAKPVTRTKRRILVSRYASLAMLLLVLLWSIVVGQQDSKVLASQKSSTAAMNLTQSSSGGSPASSDVPGSQVPPVTADNSASSRAHDTGRSTVVIDPQTATRVSRSAESTDVRNPAVANSDVDPTELWAEVKNGSTSAEVALASLYLDGVVVPQDCPQAQVLLLAARTKGNTAATNLLAIYEQRCR